jgi:hypothetical protein
MIVNYRAKSADGLSITFLAVWMIGDVTNLIGSYETILASFQFLRRADSFAAKPSPRRNANVRSWS